MKKIYFLIVLFGALLFCACEQEMIQPDPQQEDVSALKGANSKGLIKESVFPFAMWARMAAGEEYVIPATEEYGIIIFYVNDPLNPEIIPQDHNFWPGETPDDWYAYNRFAIPEDDWSVEGTAWFQPGNLMAPHHYNLKGSDVIFWIITRVQVETLYNDKLITIPEIWDCDPMVGHATMYNEVLRPYGGGAPVLGGEINAHGTLDEDGRKFIYKMHSRMLPDKPLVAKYKFEIIDK